MSEPLAYLFTWTCHGTWLHGDERGSVTCDQNAYGEPFVPANPRWTKKESVILRHPPRTLTDSDRGVVRDAVTEHCTHRHWNLLAVNVRTNHVHAVVAYDPHRTAEFMLRSLKGRSTRCLRESGRIAHDQQPWTRHGSTKYLWKPRDVEAAIAYVLDGQGMDFRFAGFGR